LLTSSVISQVNIDSLEGQLKTNYGSDKLILMNELTDIYLDSNSKKALRNGKQAVALAENIFSPEDSLDENYYLKVDAYNYLGEVRFAREKYYDARVSFQSALQEAELINYTEGKKKARAYLDMLDTIGSKSSFFRETFGDLKIGQSIRDGSQEVSLSSTLRSAESAEENGNYFKAIGYYEKAINYLRDQGDDEQITEMYRKIAENYERAGNMPRSLEYYNLAAGEMAKAGDTTGLKVTRDSIASLQVQIDEFVEANIDSSRLIKQQQQAETLEDYKILAAESEANEDYEQSLQYYKLYMELNDKIIEDEKQQELALLEKSYEIDRNLQHIQLLTQDKEIQDLELQKKESEIARQRQFRQNLVLGIVMLVALALALYFLYINKQRDHRKLNIAHQDLKSTQGKLIQAEKRIKTLLDQQLSTEVARELIAGTTDAGIQRKLVCVMFLDIRDFTRFAEGRKPEEIIKYQNEVFGFMIDSVYRHNGIINQFLGDGFMATFGAPVSKGNDSENAYQAAREIVSTVNEKSKKGEIPDTKVGIGLHTGKVVAGNVGTSLRKQYSITGNAVIIAARIEQLNKEYGSQMLISGEVMQHLENRKPKPRSLGNVQLKGREKAVELFKVI
jgi:adenylate cyclase